MLGSVATNTNLSLQIFCPILTTNHLAVTKINVEELYHPWKESTFFSKMTIHKEIMLFKSALWQPCHGDIKRFAIQDGGMCVGSPNAHMVYGKYGKSQDCKNDGKGGAGANQVYNLSGTVEGTYVFVFRCVWQKIKINKKK